MLQEELSEQIQRLLNEKKELTQKKLQSITGLSNIQISIALKGGGTSITLVRLLKALGYDIFAMIDEKKLGKKTELEQLKNRLYAVEAKLEIALAAIKPSSYFTQADNDNEHN